MGRISFKREQNYKVIENLFGSKTRVKLLHVFFTNPNRSFYVREVTRKIDEQINSVRRELSNLLKIGIISSSSSGNRLYYEVNQKHPHYQALHSIFTNLNASKESVIQGSADMATQFQALGSVDLALLSGAFTKDATSPVDVLIVGDVNRTQLDKLMAKLETEEGQDLRYTVLSAEQYEYRKNLNDRFLNSVLESKNTVVIDKIGPREKEAVKDSEADQPTTEKKSKAKTKKAKTQ